MFSSTAIDRAIREFRAEDMERVERHRRKQTRLDRTIRQLKGRVKVEHDNC